MEIEAVNEITQGGQAIGGETRAKDGTPRMANLCGWLRKEKSKKESWQSRAFQERGGGQWCLRVETGHIR